MCEAVAVCSSMVPGCGGVDDGGDQRAGDERAPGLLAGFRRELYRCFTRRADALLELADAVLCRQDRVHMLAEVDRLRWALAGLPLPAWPDGRIQLAADVSSWHGRELKLSADTACPGPDVHTTTQTSRYGTAQARAWHRMHPKLKARGA